MSEPQMPVALVDWRAMNRNTLRGFATIRLGKSLIIKDITVHRKDDRLWAGLPSKPLIGADGAHKKNESGKGVYANILEWSDRASSDRFSKAVVAAVSAAHADDLT